MTLANKVHQQLRRMFLAGEFSAGERLNYRQLATQLGVSATPLREAMMRLASERLVTLVPRAGAVVRTPDYDEVTHLGEVREAVEGYAAAIAATRMSPAELRGLKKLHAESVHRLTALQAAGEALATGDWLLEFRHCDFDFHATIVEASGNPRLSLIASECIALLLLYGLGKTEISMDCLLEANASHAQILQAIQNRDGVRAREHLIRHFERERELTLQPHRYLAPTLVATDSDPGRDAAPPVEAPAISDTPTANKSMACAPPVVNRLAPVPSQ